MDIQPHKTDEECAKLLVPEGVVDQRRRRFSSGGAAGTAVLLSLTSRSAMGGWGGCTGSELASGNLSRTGTANPCGCSPGYWWNNNGYDTWDKYLLAYPRSTAKFNEVFGITYFNPDVYLSRCGPGSDNPRAFLANEGGLKNVAMHAVSALFNAAFFGSRYPVNGLQTPGDVITAFQAAFGAADSGRKDRLKAFVTRVDVYTSQSTWCSGNAHGGL